MFLGRASYHRSQYSSLKVLLFCLLSGFLSSFSVGCSCLFFCLEFLIIRFVISTFLPLFFIEMSFVSPPPLQAYPSQRFMTPKCHSNAKSSRSCTKRWALFHGKGGVNSGNGRQFIFWCNCTKRWVVRFVPLEAIIHMIWYYCTKTVSHWLCL